MFQGLVTALKISIHSLVKRETGRETSQVDTQFISIHSLVKRETGNQDSYFFAGIISIHSLVKRETHHLSIVKTFTDDFNPLPRKEGDQLPEQWLWLRKYFNPLPRKEGDTGGMMAWNCTYYFNPLPRKEGDAEAYERIIDLWEFQSTPS